MISAAVGRGGETMISAQTVEALWNAVKHVKPLSIGAELLARPGPDVPVPRRALGEGRAPRSPATRTRACPNPLAPTGFDLEPPDMARFLGEFADGGLINIAGGCCGNTPEHIAAIAKALEGRHRARSRDARHAGRAELASRDEAAFAPLPPLRLAAVHAADRAST